MGKKSIVFISVLSTIVSLIIVKSAFAAITNSAHDFKSQSWSGGQICVVCHTPHNATSAIAPLWNHTLSTATYTVYSSPSLTATVGQPSSSSKACLSCHDGTVAYDSFGGKVGTFYLGPGNGTLMNLSTDLTNDHPISFAYDAALATTDGGLYDPTTKTVASLGGKTIDSGMLINHKLECSSCHDVHGDKGDSAVPTIPGGHIGKMLLVSNRGSALCLTCHNK